MEENRKTNYWVYNWQEPFSNGGLLFILADCIFILPSVFVSDRECLNILF